MAHDVGSGPRDTSLERLAQVVGTRWAVEESCEVVVYAIGATDVAYTGWGQQYCAPQGIVH
jgi:hypothetical protein